MCFQATNVKILTEVQYICYLGAPERQTIGKDKYSGKFLTGSFNQETQWILYVTPKTAQKLG